MSNSAWIMLALTWSVVGGVATWLVYKVLTTAPRNDGGDGSIDVGNHIGNHVGGIDAGHHHDGHHHAHHDGHHHGDTGGDFGSDGGGGSGGD